MRKIIFLLLTVAKGSLLSAQEGETINMQVNMPNEGSGGDWYNSPWTWVIIAAIIIILLVAITGGWKRKG